MSGEWSKEVDPADPGSWSVLEHRQDAPHGNVYYMRIAKCLGPEAEKKADTIIAEHQLARLAREVGDALSMSSKSTPHVDWRNFKARYDAITAKKEA